MINCDALVLSGEQTNRFEEDGFLVVENVLDRAGLDALRASFPRIFAGDFDTGVYPDEWHWREGMSLPDATRHMGNAWKSDLTIAGLVLSAEIAGAAAKLIGWPDIRLGQDTIWWKPPQTKPIKLHQDTSFLDYLDPPKTVTCWLTLDDTHRDAGTIEYVPGSHHWPVAPLPRDFHIAEDYRAAMLLAAESAGVSSPETVKVEVPAGSAVFHVGEIWHGSGPNLTDDRMRRSIGIHMLRGDVRFSDRPGGYIYRRYQINGDPDLNESFFPILWSENGYRTPWIEEYCRSGYHTRDGNPESRPRSAGQAA